MGFAPAGGFSPEFLLNVSLGRVSGHSIVNKFGRNPDVDTVAAEEVWAAGGTRNYLAAAETMDIVSDNAADDDGGTGAETVIIEGLDASFLAISETVTLNGTSAVTTANSYLRVNRVYVEDVGSGGQNAGVITVDPTTTGSGSRQASIAAGDGQSLISHYTVPAGKTAYLVSGYVSAYASTGTGNKQGTVRMFWRKLAGKSWRLGKEIGGRSNGGMPSPDIASKVPQSFPGKSDIRFVAQVDADNTTIYVEYGLLLVDM